MYKVLMVIVAAFAINLQMAHSAEMTKRTYKGTNKSYLEIAGDIVKGDAERLRNILRGSKGVQIHLFSNGGSVDTGWEMAEIIREGKHITIASGECSSACTYAFMGGEKRYLRLKSGKLGYHMSYLNANDKVYSKEHVVSAYKWGQSTGVETLSRYAQYVKPGKEWDLILFINKAYKSSTDEHMYYPTADELEKAGIVTHTY